MLFGSKEKVQVGVARKEGADGRWTSGRPAGPGGSNESSMGSPGKTLCQLGLVGTQVDARGWSVVPLVSDSSVSLPPAGQQSTTTTSFCANGPSTSVVGSPLTN